MYEVSYNIYKTLTLIPLYSGIKIKLVEVNYILTHSLTHSHTHTHTHSLTHSLHGAQSFLRS